MSAAPVIWPLHVPGRTGILNPKSMPDKERSSGTPVGRPFDSCGPPGPFREVRTSILGLRCDLHSPGNVYRAAEFPEVEGNLKKDSVLPKACQQDGCHDLVWQYIEHFEF